jgi:cytochrome c2
MEDLKLTAKEQRLLDWYNECDSLEKNPTIGETCKACHTTVKTLITKTYPNLTRKLEQKYGTATDVSKTDPEAQATEGA